MICKIQSIPPFIHRKNPDAQNTRENNKLVIETLDEEAEAAHSPCHKKCSPHNDLTKKRTFVGPVFLSLAKSSGSCWHFGPSCSCQCSTAGTHLAPSHSSTKVGHVFFFWTSIYFRNCWWDIVWWVFATKRRCSAILRADGKSFIQYNNKVNPNLYYSVVA